MRKFKSPALSSLLLLICLLFAAASDAASVTREEFFAALYDARGIDLPLAGNAPRAKASDKAAACFKLGYAGMPITGITKAGAPESGKMNGPITRVEAMRYMVQSLGLSFEAAVLSRLPSGFTDISQVSAFERGCVSVAERMFPPFIDESERAAKTFKPASHLTKADLSKYMANMRSAVGNLLLDMEVSPAKGVTIRLHREGTFTGAPKWRVNLHGFNSEAEAAAAAAQIAGSGQKVEMKPQYVNYEWSLRGELLDDWRRVEQFYNAARAFEPQIQAAIVPSVINAEGENQPRYWALAAVPRSGFDFSILTPPRGVATLAPMSQMEAVHAGAGGAPILSLNAGYFTWTGKLRGSPIGTLASGGELASAPYLRRTTIGWNDDNVPIFGYPEWSREISLSGGPSAQSLQTFGGSETLERINLYTKNTLLTSYTSLHVLPTPTPEVVTTEIIVKDGRCVGKARGGTVVSKGDAVIAAYGPKAYWLDNLNPGDPVDVSFKLDGGEWGSVLNAVQAGPMLIAGGAVNIRAEGFDSRFVSARHPRSAVGVDAGGNWLFFAGDGRNGMHSIGYSLEETALLMRQLGAVQALNLDGGGSTEMLVKGQLFNWPSEGKERPVSNALAVR